MDTWRHQLGKLKAGPSLVARIMCELFTAEIFLQYIGRNFPITEKNFNCIIYNDLDLKKHRF